MTNLEMIKEQIFSTKSLIDMVYNSDQLISIVDIISDEIIIAIQNGNKVIFAGNGGSAADSQHLAAEFISKLCTDRNPLPGIAITTDTSALTAIGNDYGYDKVFARQLYAIGNRGDIFFAITTSGNSKNIIEAIKIAKQKNIKVIGFTGVSGGHINDMCDFIIKVPSNDTAKIQECHIMIGHIICLLVENFFVQQQTEVELQTVAV